ncbi:MAG TPA: hypothetical protein VGG39_12130 [Polyangiaceae bacterium]
MKSPRGKLLAAFGLLLLAIAGCQIVAGIENRTANPLNQGCVLPPATSGGYNVRIANLAPTSDQVDVCMRPAGKSDWGLPVLLNGGVSGPPGADGGSTSPSCTALLGTAQQPVSGFVYGQVSVPMGAPAATIDVKMIPGGSGCGASAIAEQDGVALTQTALTTLMLMGGNGVGETVVALPETDQPPVGVQQYRFVHASPGLGPIDFGTAALKSLPTSVSLKILSSPVSYGGTVPSGTTQTSATVAVLDNGYVSFPGGNIPIAASLDSDASNKALFLWLTQGPDETFSMYVIGVQGDNTHPLRALVCEEDQAGLANSNGVTLPCSVSPLATLSVDTFNTALYGPNAPQFTARDSLIPAAIAARTSDVMCVVEVDFPNDMQSIISAALPANGGNFPYSYAAADKNINESTPFTNPQDQNGNVPQPTSQPPCAGVSTDLLNGAISCMEQNCSNQPPGDGTGVLDQPTSCLEDNCAGQILALEGASTNCYDCVVLNVAGDTSYGNTQTQCTTNSQPPIAFGGAENSLILSRYPLVNTDVFILPSTFYRRSILYAQVQLEDQTVDLYCGFLMTTENATVLPYEGSYGNGATDSQTAWNNEQTYEAQQFAQWVQQKSGSTNPPTPAIMVGDWHSSYAVSPDAGTPPSGAFLPNAINTATMDVFKNAGWTFTYPAVNSGSAWQPQCNDCPIQENPYNGSTDQYFFSQPMLVNWPQGSTATTDQSLFFTEGHVDLGADAGEGPLSTYYGVSVDVHRPQ